MKNLYKNILSVCLLMCFALSASAQVTQIFETASNPNSDIAPKIIIEDDQLFAITSSGVYSQDIDKTGNLLGETLLSSPLFKDFGFEIRNIAVNGDVAFVTTTNYFQDKNSILKTIDGGNTWMDLDTWEGLDFADYYNHRSGIHRGVSQTEELIAMVGPYIYYSSDFGETWEKKGGLMFSLPKVHPLNSGMIIGCSKSWTDELYNINFYYTIDYGQSWNFLNSSFLTTNDVAYHYTDPNKIVLVGEPIVASKDMGKTWEITKEWRYGNDLLIILNADFDTRGSDRLYGTRDNILLYSDDYGANWEEMCQVGENSLDYIENFVQREDKIYAITKEYKVYQIDLSQIETSVEAIGVGNENVSVSVEGNNLRINSQSEISNIEIYSIGGIKLLSQAMTDGAVDISNLLQGIYIARLQTADGRSLSVKFNK